MIPRSTKNLTRATAIGMAAALTVGAVPALAQDDVDYELRQLIFGIRRGRSYRLIYTLRDNEVLVLRVRGPGQAPVDGSELGTPF